MALPRFQIMSDLHLETPLSQPSYRKFDLNINANYLCLLGDIGLVQHSDLFWFLEDLLRQHPNLTIFYVLGNHEAYQISLEVARKTMRSFEDRVSRNYGRRFFFLDRTRHDINDKVTVLGCTLWSRITHEQARDVWSALTDFNSNRGIRDWDVLTHREEHQKDLDWLNEEVAKIESDEQERHIIILTHHSPTLDEKINDPRHKGSKVQSGFVTDLSKEVCWMSKNVKCWAFGHTHYSGQFHEEPTRKLVYSNQRGYSAFGASKQPVVKGQIIVPGDGKWVVHDGGPDSGMKMSHAPREPENGMPKVTEGEKKTPQKKPQGVFGKVRQLFR